MIDHHNQITVSGGVVNIGVDLSLYSRRNVSFSGLCTLLRVQDDT